MRTYDNVINELMEKIDIEDNFVIDISGINVVDRSAIIDTIEEFGYVVDTSYGSDELNITKE